MIGLNKIGLNQVQLNRLHLNAPFPAYGKMAGGGGSGDGFPQLPGDVTRWHFGGLTNEMMAAMDDPRIEDADHKGRFLSFKNFAWKEGSGISDVYPGALVFDGVDDYGVCENFPILTKEKGYTVVALRQWITYNPNAISAIATNASDQSFNGAFTFENYNKGAEQTISYGATQISLQYSKSPFSWQTTSKYNGFNIANGNKDATNSLVLGRSYPQRNEFANFAIWELVFLDHDATEEELTKIKDYFVKTYPWLFPDQAWTVVGKTNEDEDRATIANITGNGNDLVLSNVAFSENSGYGSYPFGMNVWNPDYIADQPYGTVHYPNDSKSYATTVKNNATNFRIKFRLRGLPEGGSFLIRVFDMNDLNTVLKTYTYTENGIHEFVYNDPNKPARIILYNGKTLSNISEFYLDIIPEYEGYLVTDGVDDKVESSPFTLNKDWTIVGNWTMLSNIPSNCGIIKVSSMFLYNSLDGVTIYFAGGPIKIQSKSINAFCSDGRIYLNDWTEILKPDAQIASGGSKSSLNIASYSANFTKMAFKNLAIYDGKNLSKDDCIKAYNYLQTLKAK